MARKSNSGNIYMSRFCIQQAQVKCKIIRIAIPANCVTRHYEISIYDRTTLKEKDLIELIFEEIFAYLQSRMKTIPFISNERFKNNA